MKKVLQLLINSKDIARQQNIIWNKNKLRTLHILYFDDGQLLADTKHKQEEGTRPRNPETRKQSVISVHTGSMTVTQCINYCYFISLPSFQQTSERQIKGQKT